MTLRFRVEMTRSQPRVTVLRLLENPDGKPKSELVGSFGQRNKPESLLDKLTEDERYQLENFVGTIEFSKKFFGGEVDQLERSFIRVDKKFQDALKTLWGLAKQYDLEFIPEKEMLYALFNKAKKMEKKINAISGKRTQILEKLGINLDEESRTLETDLASKKLFQALLNLGQPLEKICQEFQTIAQKKYQKNSTFEPHYFEMYAGNKGREDKSFPKWYYTIAIDLLLAYGVNPLSVITPHKVAKHWARLRVETMELNQAKKEFIKLFAPSKSVESACLNSIDLFYLANQEKLGLIKKKPSGN